METKTISSGLRFEGFPGETNTRRDWNLTSGAPRTKFSLGLQGLSLALLIGLSSGTVSGDPWAAAHRLDLASSLVIKTPRRRRLTLQEARDLALSAVRAAENSRLRFAEAEATQGLFLE